MSNKVRISFKAKPRESFNQEFMVVYFPNEIKASHVEVIDDNAYTKTWLDCRDKQVMKHRREVLRITDYDELTEDEVIAYGGNTDGFLWQVTIVIDLKTGERSI